MLHSLSVTFKCFIFPLDNCCFHWRMRRQSGSNVGGKAWPTSWQCWPVYSVQSMVYSVHTSPGPSTRPLGHQAPVQASESYGMILLRTKHQGQHSWLYLDMLQYINIPIPLPKNIFCWIKTNSEQWMLKMFPQKYFPSLCLWAKFNDAVSPFHKITNWNLIFIHNEERSVRLPVASFLFDDCCLQFAWRDLRWVPAY